MIQGCTEEKFAEIVRISVTISDVLHRLGRALVGSNYDLIRKEIYRLGLETSHWKRTRTSKVKPLSDVLVENSTYERGRLKKRLIREGLLENTCAVCDQPPLWQGKPLVLRLDHLNGVREDNRIENLRLVCPNCDSQSPTFCGRNKGKSGTRKAGGWEPNPTKECNCGTKIAQRSHTCRRCREPVYKIKWPSVEELLQRVEKSSYCSVAKELGVSDVALKKHLRRA